MVKIRMMGRPFPTTGVGNRKFKGETEWGESAKNPADAQSDGVKQIVGNPDEESSGLSDAARPILRAGSQ